MMHVHHCIYVALTKSMGTDDAWIDDMAFFVTKARMNKPILRVGRGGCEIALEE